MRLKRVVGWDSETKLIRPAQMAPDMVCLTWQFADLNAKGRAFPDRAEPSILHAKDPRTEPLLRSWLEDRSILHVGQNTAYDLGVICAEFPALLPLVFAAVDANRITDTRTRQYLIDVAHGGYRGYLGPENKWVRREYKLETLTPRHCGRYLKKDGFRMFYAFFRDVPLDLWVEHAKVVQGMAARVLAGTADEQERALFELHAQGTSKKDRQELVNADPRECITYPLEDARATLDIFLSQEEDRHDEDLGDLLVNEWEQQRTFFWTHFASAWGLRTNARSVGLLKLVTEKMRDELEAVLVASGLVRRDGSCDTKLAKERMLQICGWHWDEGLGKYEPNKDSSFPLRCTKSGDVSLDADACKAVDDDLLEAYAKRASLKTVLSKDIPALARATVYPIHTNFGFAYTGRRTSSNPNVQNWAREQKCKPCNGRKGNKECPICRGKGKLAGVRECFVPRPGHVFIQADYSSLELCTLAQACLDLLGESRLAEVLNEGRDAHTDMACLILDGLPYAEGMLRKEKTHELHKPFDDARQSAKVANFGFPGGLGAAKLVLFARKTYQVEMGETEEIAVANAKRLKKQWLATWPEMQDYFDYVNSLIDDYGYATLTQLRSGRIRGGARYTEACNSFFQGLGADATGHAGWLVSKACYVEPKSPLFGTRIVNYVHDELICESPEDRAPEAAEELSRLMVAGAQKWIPDVKLAAEPCIMRVWSKEAQTLRDANGRLRAWAPEAEAA